MTRLGRVRVFSDGASRGNPGPAAIAYAIFDESSTLLESGARTIGRATNNEAEYKALLLAIQRTMKRSPESAHFFLDSELVVRQVTGQYRARDKRMEGYLDEAQSMLSKLRDVKVTHVPREHEGAKLVDSLVNEALDNAR